MDSNTPIGRVTSDAETPTFELVRLKLKAGRNVIPGQLVRFDSNRDGGGILIGRVRGAYENNPNERAEATAVRDTLAIEPRYPAENESTTIFRMAEVEVIAELYEREIRAPQTLPTSGTEVFPAAPDHTVQTLGLASDRDEALFIGHTVSGGIPLLLKREAIQRHFFICGTTGSGKSYAMGVIAEELIRHGLPIVFVDTQDEYSELVSQMGGRVVVPGEDFNIRISSLTDLELLELIPTDSELHRNIISAAFLELQDELKAGERTKFTLDDLLDRIDVVGPNLTRKSDSVALAKMRTRFLRRMAIFGEGVDRANWPRLMCPCLSIKCKHLTATRLHPVATAVLRELQDLRIRGYIPPYVAVIDEAHLFVPQGESTPCKQIIREGVRIGRHHGICMVLLTQSPVDIDKGVIRQCNTRFVFALEPDQLDAIRGVRADASEEMLRALPKMPRGTCILSGTYESVRHAIPVAIRPRDIRGAEGGSAPPIFDDSHWGVAWGARQRIDFSKAGHAKTTREP